MQTLHEQRKMGSVPCVHPKHNHIQHRETQWLCPIALVALTGPPAAQHCDPSPTHLLCFHVFTSVLAVGLWDELLEHQCQSSLQLLGSL